MHYEGQQDAQRTCETCGSHFTPKRGWGRFCTNRCRNVFHSAEARVEKIKARALVMYECLADFAEQGNRAAAEAIEGLKPPVEPKALLEKPKP